MTGQPGGMDRTVLAFFVGTGPRWGMLLRILAFCIAIHVTDRAAGHPGSGIAVDAQGRVFVTAGPLIVRIDTNRTARIVVHDRAHERFHQLHHLAMTPDGRMATASDYGDAIWAFTPEGRMERFYPPADSDRSLRVGLGGDPFAIDRNGAVFAVNSVQDRFTQILRVDSDGRIHALAGGDWGHQDGVGESARLGDLHSGAMALAPDGSLWFTDSGTSLRRLGPDRRVTTMAGGTARGHIDGPGPVARFEGAAGLAMDGDGNAIVVETSGRVRRVSASGTVTTIVSQAPPEPRGESWVQAKLAQPTGIAVGKDGTIYLLEPDATRVRMLREGRLVILHEGLPDP